jgi:hypothetical protein
MPLPRMRTGTHSALESQPRAMHRARSQIESLQGPAHDQDVPIRNGGTAVHGRTLHATGKARPNPVPKREAILYGISRISPGQCVDALIRLIDKVISAPCSAPVKIKYQILGKNLNPNESAHDVAGLAATNFRRDWTTSGSSSPQDSPSAPRPRRRGFGRVWVIGRAIRGPA